MNSSGSASSSPCFGFRTREIAIIVTVLLISGLFLGLEDRRTRASPVRPKEVSRVLQRTRAKTIGSRGIPKAVTSRRSSGSDDGEPLPLTNFPTATETTATGAGSDTAEIVRSLTPAPATPATRDPVVTAKPTVPTRMELDRSRRPRVAKEEVDEMEENALYGEAEETGENVGGDRHSSRPSTSQCTYTEEVIPKYRKRGWDFPKNPRAQPGGAGGEDVYSYPQINEDAVHGPSNGHECPWKQKVKCEFAKGDDEKPKGRHLVVLFMQELGRVDLNTLGNWEHFWRFAFIQPYIETELYDGVDFVIARSSDSMDYSKGQIAKTCHEAGNIRLIKVPKVFCDLCAHALVLEHLGWKNDFSKTVPEYDVWPWKTVTLTNSGVRGPLQPPGSASWVDVVGMAGSRSAPLLFRDSLEQRTMTASSISFEGQMHAQSFFISVPLSAISYYYDLYGVACEVANKGQCIGGSELQSIKGLMEKRKKDGFKWFSTSQNVTFPADYPGGPESFRKYHGFIPSNPTHEYTDPCRPIFMKFGGASWPFIKPRVKREVNQLTHTMTSYLSTSSSRREGGGNKKKKNVKSPPLKFFSRLFFSKDTGILDDFDRMNSTFPATGAPPADGRAQQCRFWGGKEFDVNHNGNGPGAWSTTQNGLKRRRRT